MYVEFIASQKDDTFLRHTIFCYKMKFAVIMRASNSSMK